MPEPKSRTTRLVTAVHVLFVTGALIHALQVCAQPFLAGWSLDGDGTALDLHDLNGSIIVTISLILIPLSILWWRLARGSFRAVPFTVLLFAAETFQLGMGYADILVVHIPLGVAIVLGSLNLFVLSLRPRHRMASPARQRAAASKYTAVDGPVGG